MGKIVTAKEMAARVTKTHGDVVTLVESTYKGTRAKCLFVDKDYGEWWATPDNIARGRSHPSRKAEKIKKTFIENHGQVITIDDCQRLATSKGGKFLSEEYINSNTKYKWECQHGHQWVTTHGSVNAGSWCGVCFKENRTKLGLNEYIALAESKGGKFISRPEHFSVKIKYTWECAKGHQWQSKYNKVQQGRWCPVCYEERRMITLEKCIALAEKNNGQFLSRFDKYNATTKYEWKCKEGHVSFKKNYGNVRRGQWCPVCAEQKRINTRIERYGFPYLMQNKDLAMKSCKTKNQITNLKHWKSGIEICCRGSYEVRTVQYFNDNKIDYDWQPKTFTMPDGRTYTPDCYLPELNLWIEIKGYFYDDAKEKWDWFRREYPNSELWNKVVLKEKNIL